MKKTTVLLGAVLLLALTAAAQETPKAEAFLGFTYTRFNSATNVPAFSANGGGGQFVFNFNHWLGFVSDIGAVHNGNIGGYHLDSTFTNFMFGPRVPIRISSRVTPYVQALWGGVYASTSALVQVPPGSVTVPPPVDPGYGVPAGGSARNAIDLRASTQQTAFAMAYGGGLDIKVNKWMSFRPIGLDYYMTRLQNLRSANDNNQHNLRYTTGVNFTFGAR